MKRTLAAITTIVMAIGLAVTGVSTANADDSAAPQVPVVTDTARPEIQSAADEPAPPADEPAPSADEPAPPAAPVVVAVVAQPDPATCLPTSAVSYSYDSTNNSGTITVTDQPNSTGVLCNPVYITAVSWKYTTTALWPQTLDAAKTDNVRVAAVGIYSFGAAVACGQGDIYAHYYQYIVPTATIDGAQPWERFLNTFGFSTGTPGYTYMTTPTDCAAPKPVSTVVSGQCYWDNSQETSFKTVTLRFDNSASSVPVDFVVESYPQHNVDNSAYNRTVPGGEVVEVKARASSTGGVSYNVIAGGKTTTLAVSAFESCPPEIPTLPLVEPVPVTFTDVCGVVGDKVIIPVLSSEDHYSYTTSDTTVAGVRAVTVTAHPAAGYGFASDVVTSWSHVFKTDAENKCVKVPGDPEAVAETCAIDSESGVVSGYLTVAITPGIVYTIHPVTPAGANIVVTGAKTEVPAGDYLITAAAEPGFTLTGVTSWSRTVAKSPTNCQLATHALLPASVTFGNQVCSSIGVTSGYIGIDPADGLSYFIGSIKLTAAKTAMAPGTYQVTAVAGPGDAVDGQNIFAITIASLTASCANLTTLAFTGSSGSAGYLTGAAALLMLGAAFLFMKKPRREPRETV